MSLTDTEFEIGETQYRIRKMPAVPAAKLLLRIRQEVGRTVDTDELGWFGKVAVDTDTGQVTSNDSGDLMNVLLKLLLNFDTEFLEKIAAQFFERVQFRNDEAKSWQRLAGAEDMAFEDALDWMEVLTRSVAVNFGATLQRLVSKLDLLSSITSPSPLSE